MFTRQQARIRKTNLPHREWIYRMAFETGRHLIGYEVDKVRAAVDWYTRAGEVKRPIDVVGSGPDLQAMREAYPRARFLGRLPDHALSVVYAQARAVIVRYNLKPADIRVAMRGRSKVKPKFRNPDDASQTWAGRGLRPRWLVEALKQKGKKLEDFAI